MSCFVTSESRRFYSGDRARLQQGGGWEERGYSVSLARTVFVPEDSSKARSPDILNALVTRSEWDI